MRIRSIKPEVFTHEGLFELERELGLPVRWAWAGLWCAADREGRFRWEPRRLGVQILPYDDVDFSRVLHAFLTRGFVVRYRVGDAWFGAIPSFSKHQVVNNRERQSDLPDVSEAEEVDASATRGARVKHASQGEGKGREGNMEGKGTDTSSREARDILAFLNQQSGREFRETQAHLQFITARLKEVDGDADGIRVMIQRQVALWKSDHQMSRYLRPETLFNRTKFASYYDDRNHPLPQNGQHGCGSSVGDPDLWDRTTGAALARPDDWSWLDEADAAARPSVESSAPAAG